MRTHNPHHENKKFKKICHINVRSILADGRLVDLEILSGSHEIDVLCVTETWLTNLSINICINGFQPPIRRDRCGKRGGGVAIFVRNGIPMQAVTLNNQLESVCVKLCLP